MMSEPIKSTVEIFSVPRLADAQDRKKIIEEFEKEAYLNCKFWKQSLDEAEFFSLFYTPSNQGDFHRVIGILSGEYLKNRQNLEVASRKITKAVAIYYHLKRENLATNELIKVDGNLEETNGDIPEDHLYKVDDIIHLEPTIKEILQGCKDKKINLTTNTLDEILNWAETKITFQKEVIVGARKEILITREVVFKQNSILNKTNIKILKPILLNIWWMYYEDIKTLLFPNLDLLDKLIKAVSDEELSGCCSLNDKNSYYYNPISIIKWLMKQDYLEQWLIDEFKDLKIKSIKESSVKCREPFESLKKLSNNSQNKDRNDILQIAANKILPIYLKYPREDIRWVDSIKDNLDCVELRYEGLGQLKIEKKQDSYGCHFGGLTIDMLLYNEEPSILEHHREYEIDLVPTKEEAKYGLRPYIKISKDKIKEAISDENLMILKRDWVNYETEKHGNRINSKSNKVKIIKTAINDLLTKAKSKSVKLNKNEMPGTKDEFHRLLKQHYRFPDGVASLTFNDYLREVGIGFKKGAKTGKSDLLKSLMIN